MAIPYYPFTGWHAGHAYVMAYLMTVAAVVAAYYIGYHEAKRKGIDPDTFFMSALWMGAGCLIGGWAANLLTPGHNFLNIFRVGFQSWGVISGGFLGLLSYCVYGWEKIRHEHKRMDIFLWTLTDIWVLGAAIGTFFYRIGCFLSHCIEIGTQTDLPWAVIDRGIARHPINIYYSLTGLVIFLVLVEINRRWPSIRIVYKNRLCDVNCHNISVLFLLSYSLSRFILDFFRVYEVMYMGMGFSQILFLISTLACASYLMLLAMRYRSFRIKNKHRIGDEG